jgi:dihydropteroate synthase
LNPAFESLARQARSRTLVMGIVNLTPDSFFDGGRNQGLSAALATAREMAQAGADLLDLGGESTRPGAPAVPLHEEMARVRPLAEALAKELPGVAWSIDTTKPQIAAMALDLGACLVNDQDACADPAMARLVAERGCGICLMHRLGSAQGMAASPQEQSHYSPFGVVAVVTDFLQARAAALQAQGVERAAIWLDPGFGFNKTVAENFSLLKHQQAFAEGGYGVLVGTSRKSSLGAVLGGLPAGERLEATAATVAAAVLQGAACVRVHDVKAMARVARVAQAIRDAD